MAVPSVPTLASQDDPPGKFRVGTLTYTLGGLIILFAYMMLGDFAFAIRERCISDLFQVQLRKCAVSDFTFAILVSALPALMTVLIVPAISVMSDQYRSRLGRRIPFLIASTPFVVLGVLGLAFAPWLAPSFAGLFGGGEKGHQWAVVNGLALGWTLFEGGAIVTNVVFSALVNDVVPAKVIGRFYGMFRVFSLLAGILFNYYLFQYAEEHSFLMFVGVAVIYSLGFGILCWKVKEGNYPAPPQQDKTLRFSQKAGNYTQICVSHRFYVLLIVAFSLAQLAAIPINAFSLKSAQAFGLDDSGYGMARAITYTVSLVLAYPLGWLTDLWHPIRTSLWATILYGAGMLLGGLMIHSPTTFQFFFILHGVLSGVYFTTVLPLFPRLLPREQFSQMNSAALVFSMILVILVSMSLGQVLDLLHHDYRMTFYISAGIAFSAVMVWIYLYRMFNKLGGIKAYVPPSVESGSLQTDGALATKI